jgi:hypothetical protein
MHTWLLLLMIGIQTSLLCLLWWTSRQAGTVRAAALLHLQELRREQGELVAELLTLQRSLVGLHQALVPSIQEVLQYLDQRKRQEAETAAQIGSFLPEDESAAAFEATLRQSENRFIAANGPIQYSSRPSRRSEGTSRREPLIRRRSPSSAG